MMETVYALWGRVLLWWPLQFKRPAARRFDEHMLHIHDVYEQELAKMRAKHQAERKFLVESMKPALDRLLVVQSNAPVLEYYKPLRQPSRTLPNEELIDIGRVDLRNRLQFLCTITPEAIWYAIGDLDLDRAIDVVMEHLAYEVEAQFVMAVNSHKPVNRIPGHPAWDDSPKQVSDLEPIRQAIFALTLDQVIVRDIRADYHAFSSANFAAVAELTRATLTSFGPDKHNPPGTIRLYSEDGKLVGELKGWTE